MAQCFSFDVIIEPNELENLLGECITEENFVGYNETEIGENLKITFFYDDLDIASDIRGEVIKKYSTASEVCEQENRDWNEEWRKTMQPVKIADNIWVSPKWLKPPLEDGDSWIKIEPQMAFGTGHHETTRLAAKLICGHSAAKSLLDIGTGSGVLAFVAQIAGYKSIMGLEIDETCYDNLQENLADNKGRADIRFVIGSVDKIGGSAKFDTIVMNMIRSESAPLLRAVCRMLSQENGTLLWSGILLEERDIVIAEAQKVGFELAEEITENDWWGGKFIIKK
ncbi:MAG: 50S ribosomal protein L11 methyltransferase [Chitinivibrionia bacterium]|nr:50S ribosomal protein L11 methyltransferase [Chitinivibrionia bacterium]